jgi:hypothetical protein
MTIQLKNLGAVLLIASLTAAGCGGSSGGGDSVSPTPPTDPTPPPSGGIVRTGVAVGVGPITGFGSIIVNGITYNTDGASFTRDDNPSSQEDFKVGETVVVKGRISDDNSNAVAESVELDEIVEGPVSSLTASGITVLGQTVTIGLNTSVDDSCPASLDDASIAAVEVFGNVDASGVIVATRIECKTDLEVDEYEINGTVSSLNAGNFTFSINGLQVNYSSAEIDDNFPGGTRIISEGDPVEVKGLPGSLDDSVTPPVLGASKVEYRGGVLDGTAGDHYEVEGFISDFASTTQFNVRAGSLAIAVTTTSSTVYEGGSAADLGNNLKVEVEGELDSNNNLLATKIEIKTSTNVRVVGLVDAVSATNNTVTILSITVNTSTTTTRFEDKTDARIEPFRIGDIRVGDYIEARGQELPPGEITAFLIERDDPDADTELRGFVEPASVVIDENDPAYRDSFRILGVTIDATAGGISYRDTNDLAITADQFWAVIEIEAAGGNGYLVDVTGTEEADGTTLTARELQLEME